MVVPLNVRAVAVKRDVWTYLYGKLKKGPASKAVSCARTVRIYVYIVAYALKIAFCDIIL